MPDVALDQCRDRANALLHGGPLASPHDKLCRLLMFIAALKHNGAARVTAVVPDLAYALGRVNPRPGSAGTRALDGRQRRCGVHPQTGCTQETA